MSVGRHNTLSCSGGGGGGGFIGCPERASALRVLEAAPGAATGGGQRFQDPKPIFKTPWPNRWAEIIPSQYAAALEWKVIVHGGVEHG